MLYKSPQSWTLYMVPWKLSRNSKN
jgi:hypothetical protein